MESSELLVFNMRDSLITQMVNVMFLLAEFHSLK